MNNENKELMQFLSGEFSKISEEFGKIHVRLDQIEGRLTNVESRLDRVENRLDVMEVRQNKMSEQLTELQIAQKRFELSANKRLAKLQDGMDTVVEILRMNDLVPN